MSQAAGSQHRELEGGAIAPAAAAACLVLATALACWVWAHHTEEKRGPRGLRMPPSAPGALPVLGHALAYKKAPAEFLTALHSKSSGAFRLNLAGFQTFVVSDEDAVRQVVNAPESVLSERQGVADFGFLEALGDINVFLAVSIHKRILRSCLQAHGEVTHLPRLVECIGDAIRDQAPLTFDKPVDLMPMMRRVMLQATISFAVGDTGPEYPVKEFIDDYMAFQDKLEGAIAASAVLPPWVARPLKLRPVQAMRMRIALRLSKSIASIWENTASPSGVWMRELRGASLRNLPGWNDFVNFRESSGKPLPGEECGGGEEGAIGPCVAAEVVLSLLFAAHKNPSIGASQTLLMAMEAPHHMERLEEEIGAFMEEHLAAKTGDCAPSTGVERSKALATALGDVAAVEQAMPHLSRCISEACRLTAHTIGAIRKVSSPSGFEFTCSNGTRYWAPDGSYLAVSHIAVSLDERIFPQAAQFKPERFSSSGLISHVGLSEYHYTTFSQGLHRCPGQRLAMLMMKLVSILLLQRFRLVPVAPIPPLDFSRATLAQRAGPCLISLVPIER